MTSRSSAPSPGGNLPSNRYLTRHFYSFMQLSGTHGLLNLQTHIFLPFAYAPILLIVVIFMKNASKMCKKCEKIRGRSDSDRMISFDELIDRLTQIVQRLFIVMLDGIDDAVLNVVLQNDFADIVDG